MLTAQASFPRWRFGRAPCRGCDFPWVRDPHLEGGCTARKQSKPIGRQQTVGSLRRQRTALGSSASLRAITRVNVEQAPKTLVVEADPPPERGKPRRRGREQPGLVGSTGVMTMARDKGNSQSTRETRRGGQAGRLTRRS